VKKVITVLLVALFLTSGLAFAEQKGNICVATKEKSSEAAVSDLAAQAPYLLIFDEKGNFAEAIVNPFKGKNEAGKLMIGFLVEKGVTAIIGRDYCGDIIDILKNKGISPYNVEGSAAEAAAQVAQGKVPEALRENALVANHKEALAKHEAGRGDIIAVAANGETRADSVSAQAGGAAFFLIFNKSGELVEKLANSEKNGDSPGIAVVDFLAGKGATVVVAEGFGPKIIESMKNKGIRVVAFKGSVHEALKEVVQPK
jgi:predicted Fe-Mo cluster-binding NifX family protein